MLRDVVVVVRSQFRHVIHLRRTTNDGAHPSTRHPNFSSEFPSLPLRSKRKSPTSVVMALAPSPQSIAMFSNPKPRRLQRYTQRGGGSVPFRAPSCSADVPTPDFLSSDWLESRRKRPFGPRLNFTAEEAVQHQLDALKYNDLPRPDYGVEVMYRVSHQFAGFDPFERSTYFGRFFDLGQFERFRRIFHHSTYRVLLGHKERKILSSLRVEESRYVQRVLVCGSRPEEEEVFQFTMVQRIGGIWDGFWLTESLLTDDDRFSGGIAY